MGILVIAGFSVYLEPPPLGFTPDGFLTIMMAIFFGGIVSRPFFPIILWETSRNIAIFTSLLLVPILVGFDDATVKDGSPRVKFRSELCPVIFAGATSLILRCKDSVAIMERSDVKGLEWTVDVQ